MASVAHARLTEERKAWRREHPWGFSARPLRAADGSTNLLEWECIVPGRAGTPWEGGAFPVRLTFPADFPARPPVAFFTPPIFHINVFTNGAVCLSLFKEEYWVASTTIPALLIGLQTLLETPNPESVANLAAYNTYMRSRAEYDKCSRECAARAKPKDEAAE